jgi:hypothetical protein
MAGNMIQHSRGRCYPSLSQQWPSNGKRAQGMPGAVAPALLVCRAVKKTHTSWSQVQPNTSGIPRAMFDDLFRALLGVPGVLVTVVRAACRAEGRHRSRSLDTSIGVSGPHGFVERVTCAYVLRTTRPSHPRPTVRDDRPKRPSSSRRDTRDAAGDLPDEASESGCGRLARRAKCAWQEYARENAKCLAAL